MPSSLVKVGFITSAHGIKGHVKVKTFTQAPENLCAYGQLSDDKGTKHTLSLIRVVSSDSVIAHITGVNDRNQAEALRGVTLYVDRGKLPKAEEEEYYHADLIDLDVRTSTGELLGRIQGIHNFGAGDILDIKITGGRSVFVLFDRENVPTVDVAGGFVVIKSLPQTEDELEKNKPHPPHKKA